MKLTGQCAEDFNKWYLEMIRKDREDYFRFGVDAVLAKFNRTVESMKWGVYQDFFNEKEVLLYIYKKPVKDGSVWGLVVNVNVSGYETELSATRKKAIIEANKVYNEIAR